jgi:uncharacterized RDD family membrane protein YckC
MAHANVCQTRLDLLDGRLSLTTPEGIRLSLTPAGPVARAWAWLIDFILLCSVAFVLALIASTAKVASAIAIILWFVFFWGYPVICEVYFKGQSLGKRAAGIEVLRSDGLPVGWRESSIRSLLMFVDMMPFFYLSGLICMLSDRQYRRLGDIVAHTQVVYRDKAATRKAIPKAEPLPLPFPMTPDQQRTLVDLFEREHMLPAGRLTELGSIAEGLTGLQGDASLERMRSYVAGLVQ